MKLLTAALFPMTAKAQVPDDHDGVADIEGETDVQP
jgi:hypothetical protein